MTDTKRMDLHAYLTPDSHRTWHNTARLHGVTLTALLEALADNPDDLELMTASYADTARQIDATRRNRAHRYT